jgi:hypothetical protein
MAHNFHFEISGEKKDIMFATKPEFFSIRTIVVPMLVRLEQLVNLIASTSLNLVEQLYVLVEHVYALLLIFYVLVEPIFVLPI